MTTHDFALWLHGFTELTGGQMPTEAQWAMIVEHLDLAFNKVTKPLAGIPQVPARPMPFPNSPSGPRILTEKQGQEELKQKLVEHARKQANEAEMARRAAQKADQAKKEEQAKKEAQAKNDAETQRNFAEKLNEALKRAAEAEKKRKEDEYYKDRTRPSPFFPQLPQPQWVAEPNWPGGIAYKHPGSLDPNMILTC